MSKISTSGGADAPLRFAMLGMIAGNGHPYSWSAIVNGYDPAEMAKCPYPTIPRYLQEPSPWKRCAWTGARITHVWTDNPREAPLVAAASLIPNVVARPEDVIGQVDGVFLATDDGLNHVRRARPFIEAGLPVFVDKPLSLSIEDLQAPHLLGEERRAHPLSSSGMRYAPELDPWLADRSSLGNLRWISSVMAKAWDNYGIHALEPVFRLLGPGFVSARLESQPGLEIAHLVHRSGAQVNIPVIYDGAATFGTLHLCGLGGQVTLRLTDTYPAFRRQMVAFIDFVRSGVKPYPFAETVELMAVLIAGLRSRAEGSRRVEISEILGKLDL